MAEIIFNANFPELAKDAALSAINEFSWVFPPWLQRLCVGYHAADDSSSCYITVEKNYRFANLTVCGHWMSDSVYLQREQILHELIHLHNVPVKNFALEVFKTLCDDETAVYNLAKNELTAQNESATADLTYAIMNKFNEIKGDLQN